MRKRIFLILLCLTFFSITYLPNLGYAPKEVRADHQDCDNKLSVSYTIDPSDPFLYTFTIGANFSDFKYYDDLTIRIFQNFGERDKVDEFSEEVRDLTQLVKSYDFKKVSAQEDQEFHIIAKLLPKSDNYCGLASVKIGDTGGGGSGECNIAVTPRSSKTDKMPRTFTVSLRGKSEDKITILFTNEAGVEIKSVPSGIPRDQSSYQEKVFIDKQIPGKYYFKAVNKSRHDVPCAPTNGVSITISSSIEEERCLNDPLNCFRFGEGGFGDLPSKVKFGSIGEIITALLPSVFVLAGMLALLF